MSANNSEKYNGSKNYETWLASLWFDNTQSAYEEIQEQAKTFLEEATYDNQDAGIVRETAIDGLQEYLADMVQRDLPELDGLAADLLHAALDAVDFYEIAGNIISEIPLYAIGYNMPGYMPDSEPSIFLDYFDAQRALAELIREGGESEELDETETEKLADAVECEKDGVEIGITFGKFHYWLLRC